jgi:hypothetical protein
LLRNRFYIGDVVYRGEVCPGEHAPILDCALFEAVQEKLAARRPSFFSKRAGSAALLIGKLYDERGHRMTPSHARKAGRRYRYYVSSALSQGRPEAAGSVARVAAETIEALVVRALRERFPERVEADDRALVLDCLAHAVIRDRVVEITLTQHDQKAIERDATESLEQRERSLAPTVVRVDWAPRPKRRRREIILPAQGDLRDHRPIRAETRATLVRAIARGRRWLDEITTGTQLRARDLAATAATNSTRQNELSQRSAALNELTAQQLREEWRRLYRGQPPRLSRDLLIRTVAYRMQELAYGGLSKATQRKLDALTKELEVKGTSANASLHSSRLSHFIRPLRECELAMALVLRSTMVIHRFVARRHTRQRTDHGAHACRVTQLIVRIEIE